MPTSAPTEPRRLGCRAQAGQQPLTPFSPAPGAELGKQILFFGGERGNADCRLVRWALLPDNGDMHPYSKSTFFGDNGSEALFCFFSQRNDSPSNKSLISTYLVLQIHAL